MLSVRYAVTREEVWSWYVRTWLRKLWKYHLVTMSLLAASLSLFRLGGTGLSGLLIGLVVGGVLIGVMVVWPQLSFRPEERVLTFDAEGVKFVRGSQSGSLSWNQITSISNRDEGIIIEGRKLNSFIVPKRALGLDPNFAATFEALSALHRQALSSEAEGPGHDAAH